MTDDVLARHTAFDLLVQGKDTKQVETSHNPREGVVRSVTSEARVSSSIDLRTHDAIKFQQVTASRTANVLETIEMPSVLTCSCQDR